MRGLPVPGMRALDPLLVPQPGTAPHAHKNLQAHALSWGRTHVAGQPKSPPRRAKASNTGTAVLILVTLSPEPNNSWALTGQPTCPEHGPPQPYPCRATAAPTQPKAFVATLNGAAAHRPCNTMQTRWPNAAAPELTGHIPPVATAEGDRKPDTARL